MIHFSDASCLSVLWTFTLPTSRPRVLRPLSKMKLCSAPIWRRFQVNVSNAGRRSVLLFRFPLRWCLCATCTELAAAGARSMSALSSR